MKLTAEVIAHAEAGPDALRESQLNLRGLKAPAVENLGAAPDVYDALNLTDNDIRTLTNFPVMKRLRMLYAANNQISRIDPRLAHQLPYLTTLVLTNNNLSHLAAAAFALAKFPYLEYVSLLSNPISAQQHYRHYLIWRCPKIRVLDFQRVTDKERALAKTLFETPDGRPSALATQLGAVAMPAPAAGEAGSATFEPGHAPGAPQRVLTVAEKTALAQAIENATSVEEIRALEERIRLGQPLPTETPQVAPPSEQQRGQEKPEPKLEPEPEPEPALKSVPEPVPELEVKSEQESKPFHEHGAAQEPRSIPDAEHVSAPETASAAVEPTPQDPNQADQSDRDEKVNDADDSGNAGNAGNADDANADGPADAQVNAEANALAEEEGDTEQPATKRARTGKPEPAARETRARRAKK